MTTPKTSLTINKAELQVHLGWEEEERQQKQSVFIDIEISFPQVPEACWNDNLKDTYCYATLLHTLQNEIRERSFRLIENLTFEIHQIIQAALPANSIISVRLTKRPKIANFDGSVCFSYGNET